MKPKVRDARGLYNGSEVIDLDDSVDNDKEKDLDDTRD